MIQAVKTGVPRRMPDSFFKATRRVNGNTAEYFKTRGTRKMARVATYGSPAKEHQLKDVSLQPVVLMHAFESIKLPGAVLVNLLDPEGGQKQELGMEEVSRQVAEFAALFDNLRVNSVQMAMASGALSFDSDGNLLPNATNAQFSVNFAIPTGNQGQLDVQGTGNPIISAPWSSSGTPIIKQIGLLQQAAVQLTGYELQHAFYGTNIPSYLANNSEGHAFLARNPVANQQYLDTGQIPQGVAGLQWHAMGSAFFEDPSGNIQTLLGPDSIVFTPEPSPEWYELVEGSMVVPTDLGKLAGNAGAGLADLREAFGRFAYAKVTDNPVAIEMFAGDTFLPLIKVPAAVFQATVKF
jgi:hypothetical protein